MNFSCLDFVSLFSSMIFRILETVDCANSFVVRINNTPLVFTTPEITSSFTSTSRRFDSPVKDAVSREELPETTIPSNGIRSPGFTWIISPICTSVGSTLINSVPLCTYA